MTNQTLPQIEELVHTLTDIRNLASWGAISGDAETDAWHKHTANLLIYRLTKGVTPDEARTEAHNWIVTLQTRYGANGGV